MYEVEQHHSLRDPLLGWFVGGTKLDELVENLEPWIVDIALEMKKLVDLMEQANDLEDQRNELYRADLRERDVIG